MLWFDNNKEPIVNRMMKALDYYKNKYDSTGNCIWLSKHDYEDYLKGETLYGTKIVSSPYMTKSHFWVGHE